MSGHEKIDYVELPANDLKANKKFFELAFGWQFEDFGDEYTAFANQGLDGGDNLALNFSQAQCVYR